jgi:hypothetical protein
MEKAEKLRKNDAPKQMIKEHLLPNFQGLLEQAILICKQNLESANT